MKLWVSDTSPLLFLAKLDRLDLLRRQTAVEVIAPEAVFREIQQRPDEANRKLEDARRSWLQARAVTDRALVEVLLADLDEGEAEAISLAFELGADRVLMDDLDGRRFARRIGPACQQNSEPPRPVTEAAPTARRLQGQSFSPAFLC